MSAHSKEGEGEDAPRPLSQNDSEENKQMGYSPSKAKYLRKLVEGVEKRNMRSRSHLSVTHSQPNLDEANGNISPGIRAAVDNASRNVTTNSLTIRQNS